MRGLWWNIWWTLTLVVLLIGTTGCPSREGPPVDRNTLVVASFNIAWLGDGIRDRIKRTEKTYRRIAEAILDAEADIIGLQEVENAQALERLLTYLPGYNYHIGTKGRQQKLAVLYREDIEVDSEGDYLPLMVDAGRHRPGLLLNCRAGNFDCLMMVVHLKSTSRYDSTAALKRYSRETRRRQSAALQQWVEQALAQGTERDLIILGDFNDYPTNDKTPTLTPLVVNPELNFVTADLRSCKRKSWKAIDHIVMSRSAQARFIEGTASTINFYHQYKKKVARAISDHCPVVAHLDLTVPDND